MHTTTRKNAMKLQNLYAFLIQEGMSRQKDKVMDLIKKIKQEEMVIGFAGHFSAGKSTLINTLLESRLLPSSPIPTSANIVRLRTGPLYTKAYFLSDAPVKYEADVEPETIQAWCRDGESVTGLEISRPDSLLPPHVSVLDTPGVDSTNDADRLITESSLHVMDYMYYVMDYNHVQSEVNLLFLLEMQQRKTPFSVVINQVDKHVEDQLRFDDYRKSVEAAFQQWGIHPEAVYYTSMRDFTMEQNEYRQLKNHFQQLFDRDFTLIEQQADDVAAALMEETVRDYEETFEEKREELLEQRENLQSVIEESPMNPDLIHEYSELEEAADEAFEKRIFQFLSNAYLMPSALREHAEAYLESRQPDFKVGLLFAKKKTEEEKQVREDAFYEALKKTMEEQLKWPVRERMMKLLDAYGIHSTELLQIVQDMDFHYPKERLETLVQSGASVTGAYVLRYTDEVAADIQRQAKAFLREWKKAFLEEVSAKKQDVLRQHEQAFSTYEDIQKIDEELEAIIEKVRQFSNRLHESFSDTISAENRKRAEEDERRLEERVSDAPEHPARVMDEGGNLIVEEPSEGRPDPSPSSTVDQVKERTEKTLAVIQELENMNDLSRRLEEKVTRLDNRTFTIALFGAFSAGKSSFGNALLGDDVLPVSPNPTTAAINRISPVSSGHPHQSAEAVVKSEMDMLEDIAAVYASFSSLESAWKELDEADVEKWRSWEQKERSFLKAFYDGYPQMKEQLGQRISVPWEQLAAFVSQEDKSCFIESIDVYYDCAWTRAGVTLVDTPGADSVNARHTNVSFQYIKDADAVLFVTYYNHPFSRADETFLKQLGRVKDSFAMDKMFFLINAKDLAQSNEELQQVESYVETQLSAFGIRNPRLYPVSSLLGLKEKKYHQDENSGMGAFEDGFSSFLEEELSQVMTASIENDLERVKSYIQSMVESSHMDEGERKKKKAQLEERRQQALALFEKEYDGGAEKAVQNKMDKQLHYVHERMMLQFNDLFKRRFNPAAINGLQQDVKEQVKEAQKQLFEEMTFDMKEEVKAVCVRVEQFIAQHLDETRAKIETNLHHIESSIHLETLELPDISVPKIEGQIELTAAEQDQIRKMFKGTKSFFEKNEKEKMKEAAAPRASDVLHQQLNLISKDVTPYYQTQWADLYATARRTWIDETAKQFDQLIDHYSTPVNRKQVEKVWHQLSKV
ncbi:dynamin family protein [Halobacillus sp. Cin3]|uniref:dynamin family protein n=1 Tax=Halobacillus sp. Cin3 TaxID=2928441 RepID=UPI00248E8904|nr:dynamin family protein [Halobacillus sp. Cin3]